MVCAVLLAASLAEAQNGIHGVTTAGSALFTQTGNDARASATFTVAHDAADGVQTFRSRYGFNVNADTDVGSATRDKEGGAVHQIRFEVRSSVPYTLVVSTAFVGELNRTDDEPIPSCDGSADLSGVTGNASDIPTSGSLSLDDPGQLFLAGEDRVEVLQTGIATFANQPPTAARTYVLGFSWLASVFSDGCEVAVRLGAPNGTTQDCDSCGYPGTPPRVRTDDGHFVNVEYIPACDPIVNCEATSTPTVTSTPTPTPTSTPKPPPTAMCEAPPFDAASYNVNGANCLFCEATSCSSDCIGPVFCACPTEDLEECCAAQPCCLGCPEAASLECTRLTCTCTPDDDTCCQTVCPCAGDCNGDGDVTVTELVRGVNIRRGEQPLAACISFNTARNGSVGIDELRAAVETALEGC